MKTETPTKRNRAAQRREEYYKQQAEYGAPDRAIENLDTATAAGIRFNTKEIARRANTALSSFRAGVDDIIRGIQDGDIITGIFAIIFYYDVKSYYGRNNGYTDKDIKKIQRAITKKPSGELLLNKALEQWEILKEYGVFVRYYFKTYQTAVAQLAVSLNIWEAGEAAAKIENEEWKLCEGIGKVVGANVVNLDRLGVLESVAKTFNKQRAVKGTKLKVDKAKSELVLDISFKGGLYEKIKKEAENAQECMEDFIAFYKAIEDVRKYLYVDYLPISITISAQNIKEDFYTRYLVEEKAFFRSYLNERKDRGETITAADKRRALIPDYFEARPTKELYEMNRRTLTKQLKEIRDYGGM